MQDAYVTLAGPDEETLGDGDIEPLLVCVIWHETLRCFNGKWA
jgi:hypothetical protein